MKEYYDALDRLMRNCPIRVPIGSKINNDTVALEAGKKRGSIKKSREVFWDLIDKIKEINNTNNAPIKASNKKMKKYKDQTEKYRKLYEEALNRELMMLERINQLEKMHQKHGLTIANNME